MDPAPPLRPTSVLQVALGVMVGPVGVATHLRMFTAIVLPDGMDGSAVCSAVVRGFHLFRFLDQPFLRVLSFDLCLF